MEQKVMVEVRHVGKQYQTYRHEFDRFRETLSLRRKSYHQLFAALKDVDFTVHSGECLGIIGTNGSGKSTLLKIITGVLQPTTGEVKVYGRISSLLELGAGFNPNYTGIENIILNGHIMGLTEKEIKERIPLIEEFAGIGEFIHQPVRKYSSGMFARLAFSVAIHVDPDILIVDEALSVGDIFFQTKCYQKFEEFRKAGKTILFVSHDLNSVIRYCDHALLLNKGEQIAVGPCKEVVDRYRRLMVEQAKGSVAFAEEPETGETGETDSGIMPAGEAAGDLRWPPDIVWKTALLRNPDTQEYGTKRAEIVDFGLMNSRGEITSALIKGETYSVLVRFRFHERIEQPIFAFTIRDLKGTDLCGTNTMYEEKTIETAEKGTTGVVRFTQRMTLQGGEYLLSLGLTGFEYCELVAYHRLYDVCRIQVQSARNTVGVFDVESRVEYDDVHQEEGKNR